MRPCVACAGVPVVYVWRYEHATLSTFACRAGPFSCRLTLAKLEQNISLIQTEGMCVHTRPCVACAGVPVVYAWRYEHATLSTFACRAGPFSCRLTLAKLKKK